MSALALARPIVAPKTMFRFQPQSEAGVATLATRCSTCNLKDLCMPCGLDLQDIDRIETLVYARKRIKRGEALYRAGAHFDSLYAVRSGFFKSSVTLEDGREQTTGFHMAGEVLGMDGMGAEQHECDAIALEDSEVCVIPYAMLESLTREQPKLQRHFHKMMSREIVREHGVLLLLGSMKAEERVAAFLLNLSQRFTARGYSPREFNLRMTREDIGSYLGMKLETVSRIFSRFHQDGLIDVQQRHIHILDVDGLRKVMETRLN